MVLRTYPIRVAGNSGPMGFEKSWPWLARIINGKLERADFPPLIANWAIIEFEEAVQRTIKQFPHPVFSDGLDQHGWKPEHRLEYKEALSEVNTHALHSISHPALLELKKLFEFTTVTLKLRRIGQMTNYETALAIRQVRPHRIVLTFLNYVFPQHWNDTSIVAYSDEARYIVELEQRFKVPVSHFNRGASPEHIIDCR